ncbi:hypothetical protein BD413DRAFT_506005 [Trametes elegans]|nr:hypothetical protein BD413DRAFT_506005 [Trametes elegans]
MSSLSLSLLAPDTAQRFLFPTTTIARPPLAVFLQMLASQIPDHKRVLNFLNPDSVIEREAERPMETGDEQGVSLSEHDMVVRLERMRVQEALTARDVAVTRLAEACTSVREKTDALKHLNAEKEMLEKRLEIFSRASGQLLESSKPGVPAEARKLAQYIDTLGDQLVSLKYSAQGTEEGIENSHQGVSQNLETAVSRVLKAIRQETATLDVLKDVSNATCSNAHTTLNAPPSTPREDLPECPWTPLEGERTAVLPTANTAEKIEARYSVLASLPLPSGVPDEVLTPFIIPAPYTLHDFIGTTAGLLRTQVGNYRVFQDATTTWCPEREEHGYYLTPLYKCSTNPRVNTAHRWTIVDFATKLDRPTGRLASNRRDSLSRHICVECFFNKDGNWYYAGVYMSFRLEDLCTQEWECLSTETSQALIKETLAGRKNTSPQNVYETGQLYSVGALKIACIGLQCIGFNDALYRGLVEHAAHCTQTGKWRATAYGPPSSAGTSPSNNPGLGLGGAHSPWNANADYAAATAVGLHSSPGGIGGGGSAPGSPVVPLGSPGQHFGRSGLVPVPHVPVIRELSLGDHDGSAAPGGQTRGMA